ncbi:MULTISPECIES: helix-hairpin-helix domain-containing protein [Ignavibacterium]|jgi:competence protein ComEA|uniref:ComEA family DNA-binding protein n=1 Tax=Ignavibacterium TaxID=795750 RepID=UPI0025BF42F2|nr:MULTISPECIES: helix-hairpin-helix domain-containing protein [Ignavibacterium]MBI5662062.1 helix-hairpin-helix domain-containing protein [Ignavibacterium album]
MFDNLSKKLNLTKTELKILGFLLLTLILGVSIKLIFGINEKSELTVYNYEKMDSVFFNIEQNVDNNSEIINKNVDYKQEVFDFNNRSFNKIYTKRLPAEKSINLNKATKQELMNLPGIGEKTAESIIALRDKLNGFKKPEDLLKVKGIGSKKLDNIKKYIYID